MNPQHPAPSSSDDGWLITPRALTSVATIVGLVYTLHAPVRYVLQVGATVDALSVRVATLEAEVDQHRGRPTVQEQAAVGRAIDWTSGDTAHATLVPPSAPRLPIEQVRP